MTVKATDLLFRRRDREGRSFHFAQAKISDPEVLKGRFLHFFGPHGVARQGDAKTW